MTQPLRTQFLLGLVFFWLLSLPGRSQINLSGKPGLLYIPTANGLADGDFIIGYTFNPRGYSVSGINYTVPIELHTNSESIGYVTICALPRFEINFNLLRPNGYIPLNARGIGDRQFDFTYRLMTERDKRPALALILSAPFGLNNSLITHALVATKALTLGKKSKLEISFGYGSPYYFDKSGGGDKYDFFSGYRLRNKNKSPEQYLTGPFGGLALRLNDKGGIMAEWDSQHFNVGAYTKLFNRWTLQAGIINFSQITLGTSYMVNLRRSPKGLIQSQL